LAIYLQADLANEDDRGRLMREATAAWAPTRVTKIEIVHVSDKKTSTEPAQMYCTVCRSAGNQTACFGAHGTYCEDARSRSSTMAAALPGFGLIKEIHLDFNLAQAVFLQIDIS
jgi:hypothetical protein